MTDRHIHSAAPAHEASGRPPRGRRTSRAAQVLGWALTGCGLALTPWALVLATTLPGTATAAHWSGAWVGLDSLEAIGLVCTGVLCARDDHRQVLPAAATAALLVVDAWFDTMTSASAGDFAEAVVMALLAELPLALLCALIAWRGLRTPPGAACAGPVNSLESMCS